MNNFFKKRKIKRSIIYKQEYENPLFPKKPAVEKIMKYRQIFYSLAVLIILSGIYFVFYSNYFRINLIKVSGMKNFTQEEVTNFVEEGLLQSRLIIFKQFNYFLLSSSQLSNFLSEKIQTRIALDRLEIKKQYPDSLEVVIKEKEPNTVWQTASEYYYLDQKGIVVSKSNENDYNKDYPLILDQNNLLVSIKEQIVDENIISSVHSLKDKLKAINIEVDHFITPEVACPETAITENLNVNENKNNNTNASTNINKAVNESENDNINTNSEECSLKELLKASSELSVQTKDGYKIIFDVKEDLQSQINKLTTVLETKLKGKLQSIKYIDLRFEDKIYYQ